MCNCFSLRLQDGPRLSGIIHLFDLGKERSKNKFKMHFPKGSKDIIHQSPLHQSLPTVCKYIFRGNLDKGQNLP